MVVRVADLCTIAQVGAVAREYDDIGNIVETI